jgi:hypothetical protein
MNDRFNTISITVPGGLFDLLQIYCYDRVSEVFDTVCRLDSASGVLPRISVDYYERRIIYQ